MQNAAKTSPTDQGEGNQESQEYDPGLWYSDDEDPYIAEGDNVMPTENTTEDPYVFDEILPNEGVEAHHSTYAGVVRYDEYEERRDSLIPHWEGDQPTVKIAAMAKATARTSQVVEPIYDHRARDKASPRLPRGHPNNKAFTVYMSIGSVKAYCLLDSGCEGVMVSADYARAARLPIKALEKPVTLQLACQGSKSTVNHGVTTEIDVGGRKSKEYFDVANVDYYDAILGIPFLRRFQMTLDFAGDGEIKIGGITYQPGSTISPGGKVRPSPAPKTQR